MDPARVKLLANGSKSGDATILAAAAAVAQQQLDPDAKNAMWWYFAVLAFLCLCVETLVAVRTSR
jgi:hypothetical protein